MRFDFGSFLIGALAAFGLSFLAYRRRAALGALWLKIRARLVQLRDRLTASVEQRYQKALLARCDELMLSHAQAGFDSVYVAQEFDPPLMRPTLNPVDPEALKRVYDELVTSNGAKVLFNSFVAGVERDAAANVELLLLANKAGMSALKAKVFIDCTGDADICAAFAESKSLPALVAYLSGCGADERTWSASLVVVRAGTAGEAKDNQP